jgi:hypothetical protein
VLSTNGINLNKKDNKEFMETKTKNDLDFRRQMNLRECEVGEVFTVAG